LGSQVSLDSIPWSHSQLTGQLGAYVCLPWPQVRQQEGVPLSIQEAIEPSHPLRVIAEDVDLGLVQARAQRQHRRALFVGQGRYAFYIGFARQALADSIEIRLVEVGKPSGRIPSLHLHNDVDLSDLAQCLSSPSA